MAGVSSYHIREQAMVHLSTQYTISAADIIIIVPMIYLVERTQRINETERRFKRL